MFKFLKEAWENATPLAKISLIVSILVLIYNIIVLNIISK